jgi:hypothetical protein
MRWHPTFKLFLEARLGKSTKSVKNYGWDKTLHAHSVSLGKLLQEKSISSGRN